MKTLIKRLELSDFPSTAGKCFDCISADNAKASVSVGCEAGRYLVYTLHGSIELGTNVSAVISYLGGVHSSQKASTDLSQGGGVNGSMLTIHKLPRSTSEERQTSYDRCNPAKHGYLHDFKRRLQLVRCFFYVEDWLSKSDNNSEKLLEDTVLLSSRRVA